ncbi:hypothetical protein ABEB36_013012 [Hypothenemus hampei]|uniref:DDE Tnp4 domain-containing protein n=1 Tax=Hypothenemus hampei TaxID=57062 RepID=A0ABD1E6I7_HYPHA
MDTFIIEHCFGVLKQKFRQMYYVKLRKIRLIVHFIWAACVLHNALINDNFLRNANDLGGVIDVLMLLGNINFDEPNADGNEEAQVKLETE